MGLENGDEQNYRVGEEKKVVTIRTDTEFRDEVLLKEVLHELVGEVVLKKKGLETNMDGRISCVIQDKHTKNLDDIQILEIKSRDNKRINNIFSQLSKNSP